jgi:PKD repeat protein
MQKKITLALLSLLLSVFIGYSQCANDNVLTSGNLTPPGVAQTTTLTYAANQYVLAYVEAGANYTINTCASSSWDTQLTVYNDATGAFVAYNDDFCSIRSQVSFTPAFCGYVRVLLDRFFCQTSAADIGIVAMTMNTAGTGSPTLAAAADPAVCNGDSVGIGISNNGTGGLPPYTYSWLPATNLTATNAANTIVTTVTTSITYTLTITDANGCLDTDEVAVTALPAPTVNLGADTSICGTSYVLDAGNPGSSFLWSTGAGSQAITITSGGNYSVTVQDPSGCVGNDNITVTLNAPPSYDLGNDTVFCGTLITLDAGPGFTSYLWSTGSTSQITVVNSTSMVYVTLQDAGGCTLEDSVLVTLSAAPSVALGLDTTRCGGTVTLDAGNPGSIYFWSNNTTSQTATVSSSGTYYVDVITPAGCVGSDTIIVTINNQPDADLGPDTSICQGSITLDAGNPGSTYAWSNSASTQTITVGTGTYFVTVTDPSGCFDQDTVTIQVNVPPTVTVSSDTAICAGGQATLTANGGVGYLWSNGAPTQTITVSPSTNTAYYVTVVDANGCTASDFVIVNTLPGSTAQFTHTVSGSTAVFTNQSSNAYTYSWNFGDNTTSTAVNPSHTYTQNGTYTVTLTVTGPCGTATFTQVVTITQVGVEEQLTLNNVSLYPNPNDGAFTISFEMTQETEVQIQVLDVAGRIVWSDQPGALTIYNKQVTLTADASGMYVVRIITPSHVNHLKVNVVK